ncbi:STP1 protein [Plasmodium ovale wallikeri]|uniref:STP1 protein n=1 Tax=Plasmodium ovale wallikeri TaxID=864142 RepID=A0A1A9AQA4_PLAOA|nr:STP1 protein [Plasmodium ovale wallikeri]SBT58396.1 STP1 protein [Plasmodium ovale wallikeri]
MTDGSQYTTLTPHINVEVFLNGIEGYIRSLIRKYGHKDCGLKHEELCKEIKTFVTKTKTLILSPQDKEGKDKWNREWSSKKNKFYNKLFQEEGFTYTCDSRNKNNNPILYQLLSKHIEFCKKRDERKAEVEANHEYTACRAYDSWIETEKASFTHEYLENVSNFRKQNVDKYFSTKDHPRGRDPLRTYRNSKFDCEIYNPTSKSYQPIQVTKAPTDRPNLPTAPTDRQESQGNGGISVPDEGAIEKTKSHVEKTSQTKTPSDSLTPPQTKTKIDGSDNGKEPSTSPENAPTRTVITDHSKSDHNDGEQIRNSVWLLGNPVSESPPVSQPNTVSKTSPDYNDPKYQQFFHYLSTNLEGQKIPHDLHHSINKRPTKIPKVHPTYVQNKPITPSVTKSYNYIPPQLPRMQQFLPIFPRNQRFTATNIHLQPLQRANTRVEKYALRTKSKKTQVHFLPQQFPPFSTVTRGTINNYYYSYTNEFHKIKNASFLNIASGNKIMGIAKIELPTPDPSLFRSPVMIYTLVLLYTTFGLLFGKNKKKKRLKRQLQITKLEKEVSHFNTMDNYSTNDTLYENKKGNEKNIYNQIKMQKDIIHKNIILPKRKKKNRKAIIDIHMELLNECKNDEWELNKDDFLQICLEQFIKEQNKIYSNSKNSNLITKSLSTQNAKEAKMLVWNKWAEKYTPIWENFKRGNTFKVLQYYWKEEENVHLHKIEKENSSLNQNEKFSYIQIKKDIWKRWTTKQAKLIKQYKEEQWFKSLVDELENVSDEYKKEKIKDDIFVVNIKELENKENNDELYKRVKDIFLIKVLIQILMMVIEECIKEESCGKTEIVLDNLIEKLNKEKHENIQSENMHQENTSHKGCKEILEQHKPKNEDSFKELIEG